MTTLARLSFWVVPGREGDFASEYERRLRPLLRRHELEESSERTRIPVEGICSRLFEMASPEAIREKARKLRRDPAWIAALEELPATFAAAGGTGPLRHRLALYRTKAGPGRTVEVRPGFRVGLWESFGVADGLPAANILGLLRDKKDSIWMATHGMGVCRYDGAVAVVYTTQDGLALDSVRCVAEGPEGVLWFGTGVHPIEGAGMCRYDGETFEVYTTEDGLTSNTVACVMVDRQGAVWVGSAGNRWGSGLCRCDGQSVVSFSAQDGPGSEGILGLMEDSSGRVWMGTRGGGVCRYDGGRFERLSVGDGEAREAVYAVMEDRSGVVWLATWGGVCRCVDGKWATLSTTDGLAHARAFSLLEDSGGNVWIGTYGGGLSRYDGTGFTNYTVESGLASNQVNSLVEDAVGNVWAGTSTGLARHSGAQFRHLTRADGLVDDGVMTVVEDREGGLWCGTFAGASRFDGTGFTSVARPEGAGHHNVNHIAVDSEGGVWLAEPGWGALRWRGGQVTCTTRDLAMGERGVLSVMVDSRGRLWFGMSDGGICRYDGVELVEFTVENGVVGGPVWCLLEDRQGRVWAGSRGDGLCRYDGERFVRFSEEDGVAANSVMCLAEDRQGHLWLGTAVSGAVQYDGGRFATVTRKDGLIHDSISSVLADRYGHLWFGTYGGGVSCYDGRVFQTLTREDGLSSDAVQKVMEARNGDIWVATEGGVTRYRPQRTPPEVRVTEVLADRSYGPLSEVPIPESQRLLVFEFRGRSWTTHPDRMVYLHRLLGLEEEWRQAVGRRAEYLGLPVGEYAFEVQAVDRDLNYSEPARVAVQVVPDPRLEALSLALTGPAEEFVGSSAAVRRAMRQLEQVAATDLTLLILGETGTGKGLAARTVHRLSARATRPLVQVACGALPEGLVESELFGHEKGAFTGAVARRLGKVELAEGGTLFLDEIGDLSPAAQAKLLQVLEEGTFSRVGGTRTLKAQVRVISATNRDLRRMVAKGSFREDLYYRLQEFQVELPPLRARREDIPALASYFAVRMAAHLGKPVTRLEPEALAALKGYGWPGNVRELEHVVRRAVVVCAGEVIRRQDLFLAGAAPEEEAGPPLTLEEVEHRYILEVLERTGWVIKGPTGAAGILGLPASTLYERLKRLGIQRPGGAP